MKICKCCNANVTGSPLLHYENMPGKAQNFPIEEELKLDKGIDLDIYECPYCGLIQLFSEPVDYYQDVIRAVGVSESMKKFRKSYFHEFVNKCNLKGKRVLEVGAGCGEYMELLAEEDVRVYGIEHLNESVIKAKKKGLSVYQGFIRYENDKVPGDPYDGFYIMNFLEHIPNPKEFLKGIAFNLQDGAYGLVEVPNGNFIIRNQMFSEFMLDHLTYFTKESLTLILNMCGFEVKECEVIWNDYIISAIVQKRRGLDLGSFTSKQGKLVSSIHGYLKEMKSKGKKVAVWGAGHQSLAVIALAKLQGKIECVIDSADFKQNKYTPATHIPIYSPNKIEELDIGAILVMAGSYSDEVRRIIKEKYDSVSAVTLDMIEDRSNEEN